MARRSLGTFYVLFILIGGAEFFTAPVASWNWQVVAGLQLAAIGLAGIIGLVEE